MREKSIINRTQLILPTYLYIPKEKYTFNELDFTKHGFILDSLQDYGYNFIKKGKELTYEISFHKSNNLMHLSCKSGIISKSATLAWLIIDKASDIDFILNHSDFWREDFIVN